MRGEVLLYDRNQGFGFINADDGSRYPFERHDFRQSTPPGKGARVHFRADGGRARDIIPVEGTNSRSIPVAEFSRAAIASRANLGLWAYFRRCVTKNYANFSGRARRKEYWGFALFLAAGGAALVAIGLTLDSWTGTIARSGPVITDALVSLFVATMLLPLLAVTVRRLHDVGLPGWLAPLSPFVLVAIPSQKHDNKWGPVPAGIPL